MTAKKKLGLSVGVTALLVCVISVLIVQLVHLSGIQKISLHAGGYDFPMDELVGQSHLIARGKFVGDSGAFIVASTNGSDNSVFTDYYFQITDVLRGDAAAGDTVSVRLQGGRKDNLYVTNFYDVAPTEGSEAVVFLRKVTVPSVYVTDEDYYMPTGTTTRSFYFSDGSAGELTYKCDTYGREPIVWETDRESIAALSDSTPMNMENLIEGRLSELESKKVNQEITYSEYSKEVAALSDGSVYARRID